MKFAFLVFAAALLSFLLPFYQFEHVDNSRVLQVSGWNAVTGLTIPYKSLRAPMTNYVVSSRTKSSNSRLQFPILWYVLAAALIGAAISFKLPLVGAIMGIAGAGILIYEQIGLEKQMAQGLAQSPICYGHHIALALLALGGGCCVLTVVRNRKPRVSG